VLDRIHPCPAYAPAARGDMNDDREIRCPTCRALDWYREGPLMYELDDGTIVREPTSSAADASGPWSCASGGYEVPETSLLRRRLVEASTGAAQHG
jgi:hypothetical protein